MINISLATDPRYGPMLNALNDLKQRHRDAIAELQKLAAAISRKRAETVPVGAPISIPASPPRSSLQPLSANSPPASSPPIRLSPYPRQPIPKTTNAVGEHFSSPSPLPFLDSSWQRRSCSLAADEVHPRSGRPAEALFRGPVVRSSAGRFLRVIVVFESDGEGVFLITS
jgi:hypothetical protein